MTNFFQELRRRTVIRVVGIYAVVGWLLAQAAVVLQSSLNFPLWFSGVVVGLVLLGLPIAIMLAWAFELTPEGVRLTASLPDLSVIGRTSSFQFKGKAMDVRAMGETLNVGSIVEASIRRDGQRLRISAQLIRTSDGVNIWAETYDRDVVDLFEVQDDIAYAIAAELQASLERSKDSISGIRSGNVAAYEFFLKGNAEFAKRGDSLLDAIASYENAVALDPNFAAAWANLAVAYATFPRWFDTDGQGQLGAASIAANSEYAANKAAELDPDLAASQHALGVTLRDRRQWARSEAAFEKAIAVAPSTPEILEDYIQLLGMLGRWDEARDLATRLTRLDPLTGIYQFRLAITEWNNRICENADCARPFAHFIE